MAHCLKVRKEDQRIRIRNKDKNKNKNKNKVLLEKIENFERYLISFLIKFPKIIFGGFLLD